MEEQGNPMGDTGADQQHTFQPPHFKSKRTGPSKKSLMIIGGAVVAALLVAAALWLFVFNKPEDKAKKPATTASNSQKEESTEPTMEPAEAATPVDYKSDKLNIQITHRKDWTVKENAKTGVLTVTSPRMSYATADGESATGVFTVKIRKGITDGIQTTLQKTTATRDSEVIGYKSPTKTQRYYTNVSYGGATADTFNYFIVTSNTAFKAGTAFTDMLVFSADSFIIAGGYGADPNDTLSFESAAKTAPASAGATQGLDIVKSLQVF